MVERGCIAEVFHNFTFGGAKEDIGKFERVPDTLG